MSSDESKDSESENEMKKKEEAKVEKKSQKKNGKLGCLRRLWKLFFGWGSSNGDYEKRLEYLTRKENELRTRMRRRAERFRRLLRYLLFVSVIAEMVAVVYAIAMTRSEGVTWEKRALHVLPTFLIPALSYLSYSTFASLSRISDTMDQKTLERLRTERKAKIDELKEKTNYYLTQQLIQQYDLDPAAKAAAVAVLAAKMDAESGLQVSIRDESKSDTTSIKSNGVKLVNTDGLRNRKQQHFTKKGGGSCILTEGADQDSKKSGTVGQTEGMCPKVVEHYTGPALNDGGWICRLLRNYDLTQCSALICGNCHMHNGVVEKEQFSTTTYFCPHCRALNRPLQSEGHSNSIKDDKQHS